MKFLQARARSLATSLVISVLAVLTVACGSSNNFNDVSGQQGGIGTRSFVGQYLGANNLPNNQTANLNLTVTNNGFASGVLRPNPVATLQTIAPEDFPVVGQVNLITGAFNLSGNIPGLGDFIITGVLPTGNNQATYQFVVNGVTFQGVIQPASLGTPNAPGGNPGGDSRPISGGSVSNFVFTAGGGYNGENPPVDAGSTISGGVGPGVDGQDTATITLSETSIQGVTATVRLLAITIVDQDELVVGQVYNLSTDGENGSVIALSESVGTTVTEGWSIVEGTTGQATITALTDTSITIEFQFNGVGPNSEIANNPAAGTFNVSGTITGNFVALP